MSIVRHMIYGSFGTQKSIVTSIYKFDQRKGQIKPGQIRSNFLIQNFLTKTCRSYPILPQDSQKCSYNYKCQKLHFKKVTSSPFPALFGRCIAKNKDTALKFDNGVVFI